MMETDGVIKIWELLRHEHQTEIRVIQPTEDFKASKWAKSYFAKTPEFIKEVCNKHNQKQNIYFGINERTLKGKNAKDVIAVGIFPIDIDCRNKPASDKDLEEANKVADAIIKHIQGESPTKIFSGNGYQLLYAIPKIEITKDNRNAVGTQVQNMERELKAKFDNDVVCLDNVGDLPRIMRVPGTFNLRAQRYSEIVNYNAKPNGELRERILKQPTEDISLDVPKEIAPKEKKLTDESNSGREWAELCKWIKKGLSKKKVFEKMQPFKKWNEAGEKYQEHSYKKALQKCEGPTADRAKYLLAQEKPEFKSLGVGVHDDCFYFGTKVYEGNNGMDAIITSDKKICIAYPDNNEVKQFGINYRNSFFDSILDYQWSNNSTEYSIMEFVYRDEKKVELKECYGDSLKNFNEYMDFQEEEIYISRACDVESSFYLPCFEAKGRAFDNAEKGSGKTRAATLYDLQMFNPIMSSDMSGVSYFRCIESTSASIIIDDFDAIDDEKKQSQIQVMRAGYKKGLKAVRIGEDRQRTPAAFNVYNSMVINNVGGLDDITLDRCNTYYLIKSTDKKKTDKKLNDKDIKWKIQRDKKYYSALQNWELVKETYENLEVDGLSGRDLERVAPILTIGKIVLDTAKYQKLVNFEKGRIKDQKTKDVSDDWLFQALRVVVNKLGSENKIELQLDELVRSIIDIPEDDKNYKKRKHGVSIYLGKCFRNTPLFKSGKVHGGYVKYFFTSAGVLKFLEIRDYLDFFTEKEKDTLKQSIQSIQPIQPILSNQPIQHKKREGNGEIGEGGEVDKRVDENDNLPPFSAKDAGGSDESVDD